MPTLPTAAGPITFGTASPANISANVGQVGGTPSSPADVANYLTQLGSSLNNFAGQASSIINSLMASGIFTPKTVRVGVLQNNFTPVLNPSSGGSLCGLAAGGTGSVFTPSATGRVICIGMLCVHLATPVASSASSLGGAMYYTAGTTGPALGTTYPLNTGPAGSHQVGEGSLVEMGQSPGGGNNSVLTTITLSTITGLNRQQSYWIDFGVAATTNNVGSTTPFLAAPTTSIIVVEY
jgi:hypothetical protein